MVGLTTDISSLPNEILMSILSKFSTLELLPIAPTSRRIHSLILRIIQYRLLRASSLPDHNIILECFHPSSKYATPYLQCDFLGTSTICKSKVNSIQKSKENKPEEITLGSLRNLYSHFRPIKPESDRRTPRAHPAGGFIPIPPHSNALVNEDDTDLVCQNIHLESHELFSQLCNITNLVKMGPKRGLYLSCVNIGEGIIRVWRNWLSEHCDGQSATSKASNILWADSSEHVGLRMRIKERIDVIAPVLVNRDEDEPVSYTLQYEELVVRSSQLLLKVEKSLDEQSKHTGKYCGLDGQYFETIGGGGYGNVPNSMAGVWAGVMHAYGSGVYGTDWIGYNESAY